MGELEEQLRQAGLCTRETIPQHGPWLGGRQTLLSDLRRSIGQLGVGIIWHRGTACKELGYQVELKAREPGKDIELNDNSDKRRDLEAAALVVVDLVTDSERNLNLNLNLTRSHRRRRWRRSTS